MANNKKRTAATPVPPAPASRVQRILMFVAGSMLGLGVVSVFALLIGESVTPIAVSDATGVWPVVAFIPDIALPVGFVLMIVLLAITFVKRSRAAEGAGK